MSSHLCKKLTRVAALRSATPAVSLAPAVGAVSRRFLSTNATAKNSAVVGSTGPSIVVADGASAPPAEVTPAAETATLHVPVAVRGADHHDADTTAARQLRRHVTTTRTILRPLSASPWDILAADQDAQIATQRALLVRSYRGVQRRAVALHRLLRLHESVPLALPANTDEEEGLSLLRADAFSRHVSPLVLGVFTALVDPKALCCLLAPRAEMRFVNAIDAVIEAEHAVLLHDAALSEQQHATAAMESSSPRGTRGGAAGGKRAAAAAAAAAATAMTPEVAAAQRAQLVAEVNATTARLMHEVVRALYRWQDLLSGAAGEVPTHGAVRREQAARALTAVETEFKALVSTRELVARRISMRLTAPGAEVNVTRDEHETEAGFELRSQRRDALVRAKVRHGTRRLIEAHEALQTSLEASKRLAVFHNAVAQTLDPAKILPSGSPYQFSNTEVAAGVAETFRQTQLQVKSAMNAAAPSALPPAPASAVLVAPAAASSGGSVTASSTTDAASESAARLQVLLARAAQNKRDREARAAGLATSTDSATPSIYSENGYDFWTLPAVQTKVSSVVEAAPLTLLSKAMRGADVQVAYWPTEVDREDDVAGARAAEQNALKAARAAATNSGAAAALKSATATAAPAVAAIDGKADVAPGDVLSAASRVSLLAGVAAGREPLFMRTHVNKFRRLPLPYELLQAVNEHAECDLDELTLRNLRRRAMTTAGRAAGAPTRVSKSMKMPPMSTTTSSIVDFGAAAVNLGAGTSRRRNAPEELEVRLATRCDEPLRSAAPHNGAVTQEESDALADWGIVRAPTDAAADVAAVEMLRQQAQASGRPTSSGVRAAGRSSAARRITLQPTGGDGVLTASARALCMNRRQTRAAMDAAAHGESAENCFFRALLPGASSSAVSDAAQMLRFRYRVEMRNHSKTHALLMLSRRWQFIGCSGMREVVGPGFAGSCPLILPGSSHTYESSAFVPLIVPSPQQLQLHEPASPGRRRAAASTIANAAHAVSHERLLGVPSTAPVTATTTGGEEPLSATSASFRQLQDFTANSDGTVFAAAAQHAREFGSTVGWMQGAFQFVAVPADATFSQEGLNLLRKQAERASGSAAVGGGATAAPGAGPAAFKRFLRRFYDSGVSNAARDVPPLHVSHVRVVPTALDPFLHQYAVMP